MQYAICATCHRRRFNATAQLQSSTDFNLLARLKLLTDLPLTLIWAHRALAATDSSHRRANLGEPLESELGDTV